MADKPAAAPDSLEIVRRVMGIEARAVEAVRDRVDPAALSAAVDLIEGCQGKLIVSGMGKSGHIAHKLAATFASTGTSAVFVHPGEGMHGDLGMITAKDVLLLISYSGSSAEIIGMLPALRKIGTKTIAMTGNANGPLAKAADVVLDIRIEEEACPLGLAPTASTTASLALGDALAIVMLERRGFSAEDFALFHPGGALGKRLLLQVKDLMQSGENVPRTLSGATVQDAVVEMTAKRHGITGVFDETGALIGCLTDGDLRRGFQKHRDLFERTVDDVMSSKPRCVPQDEQAIDALRLMERARISVVFVQASESDEAIVGILHMHDILNAGLE